MSMVALNGRVYRPVTAISRREELWAKVVEQCDALKKIAADKSKKDVQRVEGAKDVYLELRQVCRELGVW